MVAIRQYALLVVAFAIIGLGAGIGLAIEHPPPYTAASAVQVPVVKHPLTIPVIATSDTVLGAARARAGDTLAGLRASTPPAWPLTRSS